MINRSFTDSMKYKLIASDFDNTIYDGEKVSPRVIKAIADYRRAGGKFVHELLGEAGVGEGLKGGDRVDAHHFPMPRHRVFAVAGLE